MQTCMSTTAPVGSSAVASFSSALCPESREQYVGVIVLFRCVLTEQKQATRVLVVGHKRTGGYRRLFGGGATPTDLPVFNTTTDSTTAPIRCGGRNCASDCGTVGGGARFRE